MRCLPFAHICNPLTVTTITLAILIYIRIRMLYASHTGVYLVNQAIFSALAGLCLIRKWHMVVKSSCVRSRYELSISIERDLTVWLNFPTCFTPIINTRARFLHACQSVIPSTCALYYLSQVLLPGQCCTRSIIPTYWEKIE